MVSSDNAVYAQLTKLVGPKAIVKTAHALGIRSELDPYFSIGLGAVAVNPLDMTRAYATFANGGMRVDGSLSRATGRGWSSRSSSRRTGRVAENRPVGKAAPRPARPSCSPRSSQDVVTVGHGQAAALADRPAAGKTGTTDNYGDAWFVGYTPQLAVAVWVGYPDKLKPMLTEFDGKPVAGGTLPALIWKAFMTAADEAARASSRSSSPRRRTSRRRRSAWSGAAARYRLDNGYCPRTRVVAYFLGRGPTAEAKCYANEVAVPLVVGRTVDAANDALAEQPLGSELIGMPAKPGKRPGYVLKQEPRKGFLSAGRHGAPLRDAARSALRPRAEPRRHELATREVPSPEARGTTDDHLREGRRRGRCSSRRPSPASLPAAGSRWRWSWAEGSDRRHGPRGPADPLTT